MKAEILRQNLLLHVRTLTRWQKVVAVIALASLFGVYMARTNFVNSSQDCPLRPTNARRVLTSTLAYTNLWSVETVIGSGGIVSTPNLLIADSTCETVALAWRSGQVLWSAGGMSPLSFTVDTARNRLYVEDVGVIGALSLFDGKAIWTNSSDVFDRTSHVMQLLSDGRLLVYVHGIQEVNTQTGALQPAFLPMPDYTQSYCDGVAYTLEVRQIRAVTVPAGQVLWVTDTGERAPLTGSVCAQDNLLLFRWGALSTWLSALERRTGAILWDIKDRQIISNVVIANGVVYVLDADAKLSLFRAQDGSELATIQFERPAKTDLLYEPGAMGGSGLAVHDNLVAIYFRDSNVLSVMELNIPKTQ